MSFHFYRTISFVSGLTMFICFPYTTPELSVFSIVNFSAYPEFRSAALFQDFDSGE